MPISTKIFAFTTTSLKTNGNFEKILEVRKTLNNIYSFSEDRIISSYRYLSLIVTSLLYCNLINNHSYARRFLIIALLTVLTITLNYLYKSNKNSSSKTLILILLETMGNVLILMPGGGISSPYVWYSLNTILIASLRLKQRYCWINLCIYLIVATMMTSYLQGNMGNPF